MHNWSTFDFSLSGSIRSIYAATVTLRLSLFILQSFSFTTNPVVDIFRTTAVVQPTLSSSVENRVKSPQIWGRWQVHNFLQTRSSWFASRWLTFDRRSRCGSGRKCEIIPLNTCVQKPTRIIQQVMKPQFCNYVTYFL